MPLRGNVIQLNPIAFRHTNLHTNIGQKRCYTATPKRVYRSNARSPYLIGQTNMLFKVKQEAIGEQYYSTQRRVLCRFELDEG